MLTLNPEPQHTATPAKTATPLLSMKTIELVKSTIPLLEAAGVAITEHFYERLFRLNPELKNIFNLRNQQSGRQQFALFSAIAAYAKNIENPSVLASAIERIAHKHTSFNVQPEHYAVVGHHLIETLRELAPDAFTPDIEAAWSEAYTYLASVFIGRERELYQAGEQQPGGWTGVRTFNVQQKTLESEYVTSFTLVPSDGGAIRAYKPGQYLAVRVKPAGAEYFHIRQYSLSDKFNGEHYRISVKRETDPVAGAVSHYLHNSINIGDQLEVLPPAGDFFLQSTDTANVLISAGVGLTPMISMLEAIVASQSHAPVFFLHACENARQHSFVERIKELQQQSQNVKSFTWYNHSHAQLASNIYSGLMEITAIADQLPLAQGNFYLCGPTGFMKFAKDQLVALGVGDERIHYEVFGPHSEL
ncbi:MAG TPA: NO-inducible flavohemoprotein [Cellvibrio sp.]|nr:NO-inducible flavohemoprotein [Cellvibrio sp.]